MHAYKAFSWRGGKQRTCETICDLETRQNGLGPENTLEASGGRDDADVPMLVASKRFCVVQYSVCADRNQGGGQPQADRVLHNARGSFTAEFAHGRKKTRPAWMLMETNIIEHGRGERTLRMKNGTTWQDRVDNDYKRT